MNPGGAAEQLLQACIIGRPWRGLVARLSLFPGLRAALRRFIPGYCSLGASGA
jgi:hypothetical protein